MATPKQKGFLRLSQGSLGDTTFVKSKDGYLVKEKKVQSKNKWKKSGSFQRSRENSEEFGSASTSAKLIRYSVTQIGHFRSDSVMLHKLNSCLARIIKLDDDSSRGKRMPTSENLRLLIGFDMNSTVTFKNLFNSRFRTIANRESGEYGIVIPSFIPTDRVKAPAGTTHFKIVSACSSINFAKSELIDRKVFTSELIKWNEISTAETEINYRHSPNPSNTIFLFLGLEFWQDSPEGILPLSNWRKDPLCIVNIIPG